MGQTVTRKLTAARSFSQDFSDPLWGGLIHRGEVLAGAYAELTVNPAGDRNAFKVIAQEQGTDGNAITIALIDPAGNDEVLGVEVTGTDIVVNLGTGPTGDITSSARQICTAIAASEDAAALVRTEFVDDSGDSSNSDEPVAAVAETPLAGGLTSQPEMAWAFVGTVRAGQVPIKWGLEVKEAFEGDLVNVDLIARQAGGGGKWFSPSRNAVFAPVPATAGPGTELNSIGKRAGAVLEWLGAGPEDPDWLVAALTTMKATAYTLAHTTPPLSGAEVGTEPIARRVTALVTKQGAAIDTLGSLKITGTGQDGEAIIESVLLAEGVNYSLQEFASVSEVITEDWVTDGTADKIGVGFDRLGVDVEQEADLYLILGGDGSDLDDEIGEGKAGSIVVTVVAV